MPEKKIRIKLFAGDDNQMYQGLVQGGRPLFTLSPTSKDALWMQFQRIYPKVKLDA